MPVYGIPEAGAAHYPKPPLTAIKLFPTGDFIGLIEGAPEKTPFLFTPGIYRFPRPVKIKAGQTFYGTLDSSGRRLSVITGGQLLPPATPAAGSMWVTTFRTPRKNPTGNYLPGFEGNAYPEWLFVDDRPKLRRIETSVVGPTPVGVVAINEWDTYFVDYDAGKVFFSHPQAPVTIEMAVCPMAFSLVTADNQFNGFYNLIFEHFACAAQSGALAGREAPGAVAEYCEARYNHGVGLKARSLIRCHLHHNGHNGGSVRGKSPYMGWNEIAYNNLLNVNPSWEAGGCKVSVSDALLSEYNWVHHNAGRGLWTDIDSTNVRYIGNVLHDNTHEGLMHEISYSCLAQYNVAFGNGELNPRWLYGAQMLIASSQDTTFTRNLVESRSLGRGICYLLQDRDEPPAVALPRERKGGGNTITNNVMQFNLKPLWGMGCDIKNLLPGEGRLDYLKGCSMTGNGIYAGVESYAEPWGMVPSTVPELPTNGNYRRSDKLDVSVYGLYEWREGWLRLPVGKSAIAIQLNKAEMEELEKLRLAVVALKDSEAKLKVEKTALEAKVATLTATLANYDAFKDALKKLLGVV